MITIENVEAKLEKLGLPLGSKVILVKKEPWGCVKIGEVGTVCHYHKFQDGCDIGVELEIYSDNRHNCYGTCKNKYGRYIPHECLALLDLDLGEFNMSDEDFDFLLGINT